MEPVRVVIVDDEAQARRRIRKLLAGRDDVEVVGECGDGESAVQAIRSMRPDLVFLDVQMPAPDGLGVVAAVGLEAMPAVVFVTAYDEHAVRAFELHAIDYLLKPFDDARFEKALHRVVGHVRRGRLEEVYERLRGLLANEPAGGQRLVIRSLGRTSWVDLDEIDWIEAAGSYVRLHEGGRSCLLREPLTALEQRLDPRRFVRIHRSTIVRKDRIRELKTRSHGEATVVLVDGTELKLSRTYRERLSDLLGE